MTEALQALIQKLIDDAVREYPSAWPRRAFPNERLLLVHGTIALYSYYLGVDGRVYELDLDRFGDRLDPVGDPRLIREVYEAAVHQFPELRELLE